MPLPELTPELIDSYVKIQRKKAGSLDYMVSETLRKNKEQEEQEQMNVQDQIASENPVIPGAAPIFVPVNNLDGDTEYKDLSEFDEVSRKAIMDRQDIADKMPMGKELDAAQRKQLSDEHKKKMRRGTFTLPILFDPERPASVAMDIDNTRKLLYWKGIEEGKTEEDARFDSETKVRGLLADPSIGATINRDPHEIVDSIQSWGPIAGPVLALASIGKVGRTRAAYTEEGIEPEEMREGFWGRFFRTAPSTVFGAWVKVAKENDMSLWDAWNSREMTEEITIGKYDIIEEVGEIGDYITERFGMDNTGLATTLGLATVAATVIFEPDLFSLSTLGVGKIKKVFDIGRVVKSLTKTKKLIEEQLEVVAEEGTSLAAARMSHLDNSDVVQSIPLLESQRMQMGAVASVSSGVEGKLRQKIAEIPTLERGIEAAQEAINKATTKETNARANKAAAEAAEGMARNEVEQATIAATGLGEVASRAVGVGARVKRGVNENPKAALKSLAKKSEGLTKQKRAWNELRGTYTDAGYRANKKLSVAWANVKAAKAELAVAKGKVLERWAHKVHTDAVIEFRKAAKAKGVTADVRKWGRAEASWKSAHRAQKAVYNTMNYARQRISYVESLKVLAKRQKAYKSAVKKVAAKDSVLAKKLASATKAAAKLLKKETELAARQGYDDAHTEYLHQTLKGIEKMIAEAGSPSAKATTFAEDAARGATLRESDDFSRVIDPKEFLSTLNSRHTVGRIKDFVKLTGTHPEAESLKKLIARAEEAGDSLTVTAEELASLTRAEGLLVDIARKEVDPELLPIRNLLNKLEDPDIYPALKWSNPATYRDGLTRQFKRFWRAVDPDGSRFGTYSDSIYQVARHTLNLAGRTEDEIIQLLRGAKGDEGREVLFNFLDSDTVYSLAGNKLGQRGRGLTGEALTPNTKGYALANQDDTTLFAKTVQWVLGDSRVSENYVFSDHLDALKALEEGISHPKGSELWEKELSERVSKFMSAEAGPKLRRAIDLDKAALAEGTPGRNKTLDVLSRMWLPERTTVTPEAAAVLRYRAYDLLKKALDQPDINRAEWFFDSMKKVTAGVVGDISRRTEGADALVFGAKAIMHGAAMRDGAYLMSRAVAGRFTPEQGKLLQHVVQGAYDKIEPGELEDAWKAMDVYGQLLGQTQTINAATNAHKKIIRWYMEDGNKATEAFIPHELIDQFESNMGLILKNLATHAATDRESAFILQPVKDFFRLWRTSVVTGLGFPNPRHWSNTFMGDFSQIWMSQGLGTAARLSFQQLPVNIPFFGRGTQDFLSRTSKELEGKSRVGSLLGSMMSPHLNEFWRLSPEAAAKTFIKDVNGNLHNIGDLRASSLADGVMETFENETLLKLGQDLATKAIETTATGKGGFASFLGGWNKDIADMMVSSQQRMRVGLYLDQIINKGLSPKAAAREVAESLFDWKHGITKMEAEQLSTVVAFYRFWRLAMAQGYRAIAEPMVKPTEDYLKRALTGQTRFARAKLQSRVMIGIPDWSWWDENDEGVEDFDAYEKAGTKLRSWWMRSRPVVASPGANQKEKIFFGQYGTEPTHMAHLLPMGTVPDIFSMYVNMYNVSGLAFGGLANIAAGSVGADKPYVSPPGVVLENVDPFLGMLMPGFQRMSRSLLDGFKGAPRYSDRARMRPAEIEMLKMFPDWAEGALGITRDNEGRRLASRAAINLFRMMPVVGTQMPTYVSGTLANPYWSKKFDFEREHLKGLKYFLRSVGGAPIKPFSPFEDEAEYKVRALRRELQKLQKEAKVEPYSKGHKRFVDYEKYD